MLRLDSCLPWRTQDQYKRFRQNDNNINNRGPQQDAFEQYSLLGCRLLNRMRGTSDPAARCKRLIYGACAASTQRAQDSVERWQKVHAHCLANGLSFTDAVSAVDSQFRGAPLNEVVGAKDVAALHFIHSCLPGGFYPGGIYLAGRLSSKITGKTMQFPTALARKIVCPQYLFVAGYNPPTDLSPQGYGLLAWRNGITYVGDWHSTGGPSLSPRGWFTIANLKDTFDSEIQFSFADDGSALTGPAEVCPH